MHDLGTVWVRLHGLTGIDGVNGAGNIRPLYSSEIKSKDRALFISCYTGLVKRAMSVVHHAALKRIIIPCDE